jgi:hypothetical protein
MIGRADKILLVQDGSSSMSAPTENRQVILASVTAALIIALIICSIVLNGFSKETLLRAWHDIAERPSGPLSFRFILQPIMAALAALHDGVADARVGRSPYFWTVITDPVNRRDRLREGFTSTSRILLLGLIMDAIYQSTEFKAFYPGEMVAVAFLLAFLPYLLLRGPVARVASWWMSKSSAQLNVSSGRGRAR